MTVFTLTDKSLTKQLPCTYPGCVHEVIVNKFYTPAKARCPEHDGKATQSIRQLVIDPSKQPGAVPEPVVPNHNLMGLCCPICDQPMELIRIHDTLGWPTFRCPSPCMTSVEIQHRWAPLVMPSIPVPLRQAVADFNEIQRAKRKVTV